ncbi:hypothetical protein [Delftia tsuruhatensis]|uniref:hypothetical protein n=1 Tax=Delftia tsuruhatensis TaxID=180282 RepID=UPI003A88A084
MTHILIPREPSTALLRPFIGCNTQELHEAWAAMVRIAEVQHARAGSQCLQQIEEGPQSVDIAINHGTEDLAMHPLSTAPAALAGPAWDKTRDSLAALLLGLARRPFLDFDVACIALDAATGPGMPLAYMRAAQAAPALEAPAAPADGATPGPWFVRKREVNGELRDCFVAAPDCQGLAYDACILCDDEYHDGVGRKLADCELIVAAVNQHRAALAAAPQAPAPAPGMAVTALAGEIIAALEADEKDGGYDLTSGLFGPKFSALVRRWAASEWASVTAPQAPAAPSADERTAYVEFLAGTFPQTYSKEEAEHWWDHGHVSALTWKAARAFQAAPAAPAVDASPLIARNLAEWHEDDGDVSWWAWCGHGWAGEPAWIGRPTDDGWPGYHTHWTAHPAMPPAIAAQAAAEGEHDAAD